MNAPYLLQRKSRPIPIHRVRMGRLGDPIVEDFFAEVSMQGTFLTKKPWLGGLLLLGDLEGLDG